MSVVFVVDVCLFLYKYYVFLYSLRVHPPSRLLDLFSQMRQAKQKAHLLSDVLSSSPFVVFFPFSYFRSLLFVTYLINLPHGLLLWPWKSPSLFFALYLIPGTLINLPNGLLLWLWKYPSPFIAICRVPGTLINLPYDLLLWMWKSLSLFLAMYLVPGSRYDYLYSSLPLV